MLVAGLARVSLPLISTLRHPHCPLQASFMSTDAHELSPALLRDVRDFFLKDIPNVRDSGEVMPQGVRKIFQSDAAMDEHCR